MAKKNVTPGFFNALAIISIAGFLSIIGAAFFNFTFLGDMLPGIILIILGAGLIIEGQIRKWKDFRHGGINSNELSHIVTGVIGLLAVLVGILDLAGVTGPTLESMKGIIASIAVIVIIVETWFVD